MGRSEKAPVRFSVTVDADILQKFCCQRHEWFGKKACKNCRYRSWLLTRTLTESECLFDPRPCDAAEYSDGDGRKNGGKDRRNEKIVELVLSGVSDKEVADRFGLSARTVATIVANWEGDREFDMDYPEFAAAARKLGIDRGVITRAVNILSRNKRNGISLMDRWPYISLTGIGKERGCGPKALAILEEAKKIAVEEKENHGKPVQVHVREGRNLHR